MYILTYTYGTHTKPQRTEPYYPGNIETSEQVFIYGYASAEDCTI